MSKKGMLLVVSGPSGVGKGTICKRLLEMNPNVLVSVSATTRQPRVGEVDGVNYHFLSLDAFEKRVGEGGFLEYAKVYDNYYGTPKDFVTKTINSGKNVLLEIDIKGAMQVKDQYPEGVFIFIMPPSLEELQHRIVNRATDSKEVIAKRMDCAMAEIELVHEYDYYIVNDVVDRAAVMLDRIILVGKNRVDETIDELINQYKEEAKC